MCGCDTIFNVPKQPQRTFHTFILSKEDSIDELKAYLNVEQIYFFDCDFENFEGCEISQISYNIFVAGYLSEDKGTHPRFDMTKQVEAAIVANYKVADSDFIYGFSVACRVLEPGYSKANSDYSNQNDLYDSDDFDNINDLYNNGTSNAGGEHFIAVPDDFFPTDYLYNNTTSEYLKIEGNLDSAFDTIKILATPVFVLTWNKNYAHDYTDIYKILDYFNHNAVYKSF